MKGKVLGGGHRLTAVCIDSYENGIISGRLYNPFLEGGKEFGSLMQFILELEQMLDRMDFPKAFTKTRSFVPRPEWETEPPEAQFRPGEQATFALRILFRQNASWQGSVTWMEGGQEQSFRSVLELILLMDNALNLAKAS